MSRNPLGDIDSYKNIEQIYAPELLYRILRSNSRENLFNIQKIPFTGWDRWTAYEFSWLNHQGRPQVGCLHLEIPCESLYIVESKSLKLYLNSFSFKKVNSQQELLDILKADLKSLLESDIKLNLSSLSELSKMGLVEQSELGHCLDEIVIEKEIDFNIVLENLLFVESGAVNETLSSHLFRSLCPVTGQPDWASIIISYEGKKINHESLLLYLLSFRKHQGFHEDCVERIFCDLLKNCSPEKLSVYAAFTRRGGIDINPFRSNFQKQIPFGRLHRQ